MRRHPEESLAALDRFQPLLDALPRAVLVLDGHGIIGSWNTVAADTFGWEADEVIGRSALEVLRPDGQEWVETFDRLIATGDTWDGELWVRHRDGRRVDIWAHVAPVVDEEHHVVGAVAATEDMGEIRRLEDKASELADHLLLALAAGQLGTWRWDMATGVTTWDAPMNQVFGLSEGDFDGTYEAWVALLHPDERDEVLAVLDEAIATKGSYQVDHRVIWPDGSVHWLQGRGMVTVDERGEVTGTIGCTADITAQKLAELDAERRAAASAAAADRERLRSERLAFLAEITQELAMAGGYRDFMQRVVRRAVPHLGDWCAIAFFPEPGGAPEIEIGHSDPAMLAWSRDLADRYPYDPDAKRGVAAVMRTGQTEYLPEITDESLVAAVAEAGVEDAGPMLELLRSLHLTSTITVPLRTRREVIGAMQFVSAESGRQYTSEDVALATATSGRVADGLNNMWLAEQHRRISVTLQAALLPPRLPEIPGTTVAVRYWAAGAVPDVGGDFYDVFALGDLPVGRGHRRRVRHRPRRRFADRDGPPHHPRRRSATASTTTRPSAG